MNSRLSSRGLSCGVGKGCLVGGAQRDFIDVGVFNLVGVIEFDAGGDADFVEHLGINATPDRIVSPGLPEHFLEALELFQTQGVGLDLQLMPRNGVHEIDPDDAQRHHHQQDRRHEHDPHHQRIVDDREHARPIGPPKGRLHRHSRVPGINAAFPHPAHPGAWGRQSNRRRWYTFPAMAQIRRLAAVLSLLLVAAVASAQDNGITVELDQFGVGGVARPGSIAAMRLRIGSTLTEEIDVRVQWEVRNADGDIGEYYRDIPTVSPGPVDTAPAHWLYAPLRPSTNDRTVWTVGVYERVDDQRGRRLAEVAITPPTANSIVDRSVALIGVMGRARGNLANLTLAPTNNRPIATNEPTGIVPGITPGQLPDQWYGLEQFEAILWADTVGAPVSGLTTNTEPALVEWIARGGHLIISLPSAGNPWGISTGNASLLGRLLPTYERVLNNERPFQPRMRESVPLDDVISVLAKDGIETWLDASASSASVAVRVFRDARDGFDIIDNHYEPLLTLESGEVVAVQRSYGRGKITVLGLDLTQNTYTAYGLPQGDVFWNRVLGRRADTPTSTEYSAIEEEGLAERGFSLTAGAGDSDWPHIDQSSRHCRSQQLRRHSCFRRDLPLPGQRGIHR